MEMGGVDAEKLERLLPLKVLTEEFLHKLRMLSGKILLLTGVL